MGLSEKSIPDAGNSQWNSQFNSLRSGVCPHAFRHQETIMTEVGQASKQEVGNELRMCGGLS